MPKLGVCDCCKKNPSIGVASIPYIPMSIAWCEECLRAEVIPIWAAVSNTACCGGLDQCNGDWKDLVDRSLKYHNFSMEAFSQAVALDIVTMQAQEEEYFNTIQED